MEIVQIVSDSCAAVEAVDRCNRFVPPGMFRLLIDLRQLLYDMNIRIVLVQIQGHSGIFGNDIADKEAKLTIDEKTFPQKKTLKNVQTRQK